MPQIGHVSMEEFKEAQENYLGWCTHCQDFCGEECESDAEEYECPVCEQKTCYGADQALIMGLIDF
jgi:hypothetical protein